MVFTVLDAYDFTPFSLVRCNLRKIIHLFDIQAVAGFLELHPDVKAILGDNAQMMIAAPLAGPIVEEITKGIGVLLLFWLLRAEFDGVRDGFIYGALVGVGFNLYEAPIYVAFEYFETGDVPLYQQLADRFALFGLAGHALFTRLFVMGLGLARQTMRRWLRYAAPVVGWLLGIFSPMALDSSSPCCC